MIRRVVLAALAAAVVAVVVRALPDLNRYRQIRKL